MSKKFKKKHVNYGLFLNIPFVEKIINADSSTFFVVVVRRFFTQLQLTTVNTFHSTAAFSTYVSMFVCVVWCSPKSHEHEIWEYASEQVYATQSQFNIFPEPIVQCAVKLLKETQRHKTLIISTTEYNYTEIVLLKNQKLPENRNKTQDDGDKTTDEKPKGENQTNATRW